MTRISDRIATTFIALSTLTLAGHAGTTPKPLDPAARQRLAELQAPDLGSLRAGAPTARGELAGESRERLRQAEQASPDLADLRAGATDNNLLLVIAIGVVIIALVVLL